MRHQRKVVGKVIIFQRVKERPSYPSWLVFCCMSCHPVCNQVKKDYRHDTPLTYACLDSEVQAAASHAAGVVVVEALDDLDDVQRNPIGFQNVTSSVNRTTSVDAVDVQLASSHFCSDLSELACLVHDRTFQNPILVFAFLLRTSIFLSEASFRLSLLPFNKSLKTLEGHCTQL